MKAPEVEANLTYISPPRQIFDDGEEHHENESGRNCISLVNIDPKSSMGKLLHAADTNGDGELDVDELYKVFQNYAQQRRRVMYLKYGTALLLVLLVLMCCLSFGLVFLAIQLHKDSQVKSGVMYDLKTDQPVQVASTDFYVSNGTLKPRNESVVNSAVKVGIDSYVNTYLSTLWSNEDLISLKSLQMMSAKSQSATSPFLHAKVEGMARFNFTSGTTTENIVLFQTPLGRFVLRDSTLLPAQEYSDGSLVQATLAQIFDFVAGSSNRRDASPLQTTTYLTGAGAQAVSAQRRREGQSS